MLAAEDQYNGMMDHREQTLKTFLPHHALNLTYPRALNIFKKIRIL